MRQTMNVALFSALLGCVQAAYLRRDAMDAVNATADLDACFPAAEARQREGWDGVALLDCQQMAVQGDLSRCIRVLAHAWLPADRTPQHPYLAEASRLRPDRSSHN